MGKQTNLADAHERARRLPGQAAFFISPSARLAAASKAAGQAAKGVGGLTPSQYLAITENITRRFSLLTGLSAKPLVPLPSKRRSGLML